MTSKHIEITEDDYRRMVDRIAELENAIKSHRGQKADDRCIEDDDKLYLVLGDGIKCDRRVGCQEEMFKNCQRFIKNRTEDGGPWATYEELEQQVLEYRRQIFKFIAEGYAYQGMMGKITDAMLEVLKKMKESQ